jgi:hypothetical protein
VSAKGHVGLGVGVGVGAGVAVGTGVGVGDGVRVGLGVAVATGLDVSVWAPPEAIKHNATIAAISDRPKKRVFREMRLMCMCFRKFTLLVTFCSTFS